MVGLFEYGLLAVGLVLGGLVGWISARQSMAGELIRAEERLRASEDAAVVNEQRIRAEVANIGKKLSEENTEHFLKVAQERWASNQLEAEHALEHRKQEVEHLLKPIRDELEKLQTHNTEMEKDRAGAYEGLRRHIKELGEKTESLSTRTTALSTALTTSGQARGNWGEVKLRRLFEMAGLSEHVDFKEQVTLEGGSRPDFVVTLPEQAVIPIDSKAIGEKYLEAVELDAGPEQDALLVKHAKAMRGRIADLSSKGYQESIEGDFDHVVMFVPSEAMAAAAFTVDPDLMEYAMSKSVLVTTPVTMLGLLRTVALYWQQHALAEGAREIYDVSREFYKRVMTMVEHFNKVGGHLSKAAKAYNDTVSSYEGRVLPQGRRLDELKVSETLPLALPEGKDVEHIPKE
ncbi:MAG: DNA recombination protein RmuC [Poseidonia sp.]|jgi:DNA recombination protein RmuC